MDHTCSGNRWLQPVSRCEHRVWGVRTQKTPSLATKQKPKGLQTSRAIQRKTQNKPTEKVQGTELSEDGSPLYMSLCYRSLSRCALSGVRVPGPSVTTFWSPKAGLHAIGPRPCGGWAGRQCLPVFIQPQWPQQWPSGICEAAFQAEPWSWSEETPYAHPRAQIQ